MISDTFSEFDLLTAAISDAENINSGGKIKVPFNYFEIYQ